jgi:hypothetical protein
VASEGGNVEVPVSGKGVRAVLAVPDSLMFDPTWLGESGEVNLIVSNTGDDTLRVNNVLSDKPHVFTPGVSSLTVPGNNAQGTAVRFTPSQEGQETGSLFLFTNVGQDTVRLRGTGTRSEVAIRLVPAEFGKVRVGQTKSLRVFLANRGSIPATVDSLRVAPATPGVELVRLGLPAAIPARDSVEVGAVEFAPVTVGSLSGVSLRAIGSGVESTAQVRGQGVAPRLVVDQDSLVLGPVARGQSISNLLEVRNAGDDTLHVRQVRVSPEAFTAKPTVFALALGAVQSVEVTFAPTGYGGIEGWLTISSDAATRPDSVALHGVVIEVPPILAVAPLDTLRFGVVAPGENERQSLRLRNRGGGTLKAVLRSESGEFVPEVSDTIRLAAEQVQAVLVRFQPLQGGRRQSTLLISCNDARVPLVPVVLVGTGGGVRFESPSIEFGEVVLGTRIDTTVQVINQTSGRVELTLDLFGAGFTWDQGTVRLEAGQSISLRVNFEPNVKGRFSAKVEARGRDLELTLFGTGVEGPVMLVQPATLRPFGEVEVGQVGRGSLTVSNTGRGPLRLFDLMSSRLEYRVVQADSLPLVIQPGEDRRIEVEFTPLEKGGVTGVLTLVSNDPNNREVVRVLNGQGLEVARKLPKLELALEGIGDLIDFGRLGSGQEGRQSLLIRNTGEGPLEVKRIDSGSAQVWAEPESLVVAAGEGREVVLRVRAESGGRLEGVLGILSNDPDKPALRKVWMYALPEPRAVVLTESLRFGPGENGQRSAPLAIWNRGSARLIVDLVDDSGQLQFAKDRLVIEPDQVERSQVFYRGSGGSGEVVLASNGPGQRQLSIPWQAESLLELVRSVPADGATRVEQRTVVSLFFTQPIRQTGQLAGLAGGRMVSLQGRIVPEPLNAWRRQMQAVGAEVQIPLELAANTSYRLIVVQVESQSGARLAAPFEVGFSTAAQAAPVGQIAGKVLFEDDSPLGGTVYLANADRALVGSARIGQDGSFELSEVPEGTYSLFAQEEGTSQSFAYDTPVTVHAGEAVVGVDFALPVQREVAPVVGVAVIEEAVAVEEAPALLADSTFVVPVSTDPVLDLTGFVVQVSYNPGAVALLEVTSDTPEQKNALFAGGGFPLFLSRVIDGGTVQYGGSLLGTKPSTAPDQGGVLAYFTFRALRTDAEVSVDILRRTLYGEDTVAGRKVRIRPPGKGADFDGNGVVDFTDFFLFADAFGKPATGEAAKFDLDASGAVDFGGFFIFADNFGKSVAKLVPVGLPVADQSVQLRRAPQGKELRVQVELTGAEEARGYGLVLEYDAHRLRYQRVEAGGLVLVQALQPGLLVLGRSWQRYPADQVELLFEKHGDTPMVRVREGVVLGRDGQVRELRLVDELVQVLPFSFALAPGYPNPFNPTTTIRYQLPEAVPVRLEIYDLLGRRVRTLVDGVQEGGYYQVVWNGWDEAGVGAASGIYLYCLQAGTSRAVRKLVLLK